MYNNIICYHVHECIISYNIRVKNRTKICGDLRIRFINEILVWVIEGGNCNDILKYLLYKIIILFILVAGTRIMYIGRLTYLYVHCTRTRRHVVDKQNMPWASYYYCYFYYKWQSYNNCLRIAPFYLFCLSGDVSRNKIMLS